MNNAKKSLVPHRRFKEFQNAGAWEQRKLGDTVNSIVAGGDIDKSKIQENGKYPVYANALTNDGVIGYYNDQYRVKAPAVTVTGRGEIGVAKTRNTNFTPVVRLLAINSMHNNYFLENLINTHRSFAESTGVPQLTAPQLANYKLKFPKSIEEESKIGNFFNNLDSLITLHQRKLNKLKKLKSAYLTEMFPDEGEHKPKRRFAGFTDDWEQRKLGEVVKRETCQVISSNNNPSVEYDDVVSEQGELNKDVLAKHSVKKGIQFNKNHILYGKLRPYLHNWLNPNFKGVAVGDWWVLKPKNDIEKSFLYALIQTQRYDNVANISTGSKMPRADWNLVSNTNFAIPSQLDEQLKIGEVFSQLDSLIALHQRKIDKLQKLKNAYLNEMFV